MPNLKISQLTGGGAAQAADEFVVARSGGNNKVTGANVAAAATSVGTLTSLTVSGNLTVDTSTLFVDATNNRVSVGAAALSASNTYGTPQLGVASDSLGAFHVETHNDASSEYSFIGLMKSRGTRTAPTHLQSGDQIGVITAQAYNDAVSFPYRGSATIGFIATANHTVGSLPTAMTFATAPSGSNNPVERMRIDASGNLGVGTSSPLSVASYNTLTINGATGGAVALYASGTAVGSIASFSNDMYYDSVDATIFRSGAIFSGAPTERMRLDSSGNLGLGTASPSGKLHVTGTSASWIISSAGNEFYNTFAGQVKIHATNAASSLFFGAGGRDNDLRLDASGNLGLGVTPTVAWDATNFRALQLGGSGTSYFSLASQTTNQARGSLLWNAYGTGNEAFAYVATGDNATRYTQQYDFRWLTAPSGTAGAAITFTERMRLDSSGNLGLGGTPSAWRTGDRSFDVGGTTSLANIQGIATRLYQNAFIDSGSTVRYKTTSFASVFALNESGGFTWSTAPSGTAGNAISFTQALTLFASGSLTIGGTTDSARLRIEGTTNLTAGMQLFRSGNACSAIWTDASMLRFGVDGSTGFTDLCRLDTSGNLAANGYMRVGAASAGATSTTTIGSTTATTVGAAGGASALPATPLGYIIAHVGTTQVKIPYYTA